MGDPTEQPRGLQEAFPHRGASRVPRHQETLLVILCLESHIQMCSLASELQAEPGGVWTQGPACSASGSLLGAHVGEGQRLPWPTYQQF